MKKELGDRFSLDRVNLAELSRRTHISRSKLRSARKHEFVIMPNGNKGRKKEKTVLTGYTAIIDTHLSGGITNSILWSHRPTLWERRPHTIIFTSNKQPNEWHDKFYTLMMLNFCEIVSPETSDWMYNSKKVVDAQNRYLFHILHKLYIFLFQLDSPTNYYWFSNVIRINFSQFLSIFFILFMDSKLFWVNFGSRPKSHIAIDSSRKNHKQTIVNQTDQTTITDLA